METMSSHSRVGPLPAPEHRRNGASPLASAATVVADAERDIQLLWRDSVAAGDDDLSERLAEVSHALHRAARLLDRSAHAIG